jgi:Phospholipid methyltransferase
LSINHSEIPLNLLLPNGISIISELVAGIAQSVERRTENPCVDGSIPPPGTILLLRLGCRPTGRTVDSGSINRGSNPCIPAIPYIQRNVVPNFVSMGLFKNLVPFLILFLIIRFIQLLEFEKTTMLVTVGAYHYIRHPMYGSLLFLTWGVFFKNPFWLNVILALIASCFLVATTKTEEAENICFFHESYLEYTKQIKMFIPFLF